MHTSRIVTALLCLFTLFPATQAQELEARVNINHQQVQGTSTSVFETLEKSLTEFLNDTQWTGLQFKRNERIACTFNITVKKYVEAENKFEGSLMVQCTRPVYASNYTTTVFNMNDEQFNFNYQEYDQLTFRPDLIESNLTAMLAYYVYMMIGMDMDSMSPLGGTEYFQTAQTIVNGAQSLNAKGWKAFEDSKNRHALVTDMLDGGMEPFRKLTYTYYREGLDTMAENVERGRASISQAIELLGKAKENKTMSSLPMLFTEFKRDEIMNIYKGKGNATEKEAVMRTLQRINPSQSSYWRELTK